MTRPAWGQWRLRHLSGSFRHAVVGDVEGRVEPIRRQDEHLCELAGPTRVTLTDSAAAAFIAIHEDRAGTLWVGTADGLYRYNRQNETFTRYTENQGLPSDVIQCILEDRSGRLWLSTKKGISRFDPQDGNV